MVSVLDSGANGPGSSLSVVFLGKTLLLLLRLIRNKSDDDLTLTVPLSTQVYKWVLANLMLGSGEGGVEILLVPSC